MSARARPPLARRRVLAAVAALTLPGALMSRARAADLAPLVVGVLPNISARVLFANYEPLVTYLQRSTRRMVELTTAPNFREFHQRTLRGDYDLVVTSPNLARLAEVDAGMVGLATYEPGIEALAVTTRAQPIKSVDALRGKKLALANPQSLVALSGLAWLRENGLAEGKDFATVHAPNDDSLGVALRSGESPLAIMSGPEFRNIQPAVRDELEVYNAFARVPGFCVLAKAAERGGRPDLLRTLILAFPASAEGRQFRATTGVEGIRPLADADRAAVEPYVELTRQRLAGPN